MSALFVFMVPVDSIIPKPIGLAYHHRHLRDGIFVEHHESDWKRDDGRHYSHCTICGKRVLASDYEVDEFYKRKL